MPDWEGLNDTQLLDEAQNGKPEAFGELYSRHAGKIFRFLYAHVDDRLDAEDLTNEVFLKAWRSLPSYQRQGVPFSAFLFRVARNVLIDFYRRSTHLKNLVQVDTGSDKADQPVDPAGDISDLIEHRELVRLLNLLKEDYRIVLVLRFLTGLSPSETAQVMRRSHGAIRILQYRALIELRALLEKEV